MQRLVDRIYKEFAFAEQPIQVHALDGNGDMFEVFKGPVTDLNAYAFLPVLQDPGCFYFFAVACNTPDGSEIMRRDLCWLTDPLPPQLEGAGETSLAIFWSGVSFCGVEAPYFLDAVKYSVEVAEGVEWKDSMLSRYINDMTALDYKEVSAPSNDAFCVVECLKPANWYHVRLVVHYMGFRVVSEAVSMHTLKAVPSPPGEPRVQIVPVKNSFDVVTDRPARLDLMVTWTPAQAHGSAVQRYQVHLKRFDHEGEVLLDEPPLLKKKSLPDITNTDKAIGKMVKLNRRANQWTQSKGKSALQIQHSMNTRAQSPTRLRSRSPPPAATRGGGAVGGSPVGARDSVLSSSSSWRIVYDNFTRGVRMGSPHLGDGTWWIRIRAKNALGWSEFSPTSVISRASHPTLFSLDACGRASVTVRPQSRDQDRRLSPSYRDAPPTPASPEDPTAASFSKFEQSLRRSVDRPPEEPATSLFWGKPVPELLAAQSGRRASRSRQALPGIGR